MGASGAGKVRLPSEDRPGTWGEGNEEGGVLRGRHGSPKPTLRPSFGWQDPHPFLKGLALASLAASGKRPACRGQGKASPTPETPEAAPLQRPRRRRLADSHESGNLKTTKTHGPVPPPHTHTQRWRGSTGPAATTPIRLPDRRRRKARARPGRRCSRAGGRACKKRGGGGGGESINLRGRRCLPAPIRGPSVLLALKMELNYSEINLRG